MNKAQYWINHMRERPAIRLATDGGEQAPALNVQLNELGTVSISIGNEWHRVAYCSLTQEQLITFADWIYDNFGTEYSGE
jgi:hypothetical protein